MSALECELIERIQKLKPDQQQTLLQFARDLGNTNEQKDADWENQPWTEEEIRELMSLKPMESAQFVEWLQANPPTEPWAI